MKALRLIAVSLFTLSATLALAGPNEDLLAAVKKGNLAGAEAAIAAGADVNFLTDGNAPIASAYFWPDITKLLLEKGADPNRGGSKALFNAAMFYSTEVMKLLLDAGADPNKPSLTDPAATFKTLIATEQAKGKDANKAMINAWTNAMATVKPTEVYALSSAVASTSCVPCVEMLLAKGADVTKGVTDGTLIHTFAGSFGKSRELWKSGFATTKGYMDGFGVALPAWYGEEPPAGRFGTPDEMLKLLLAKGLNINEKNKGIDGLKQRTPLEISLNSGFSGYPNIILALINNGADVKAEGEIYGPMIFQATHAGFTDVVKAMVEKGADVNTEGKMFWQTEGALLKGYNPLIIAAMKGHLDLAKYLLGAGAKTGNGVEGKFFNEKTKCLTKVTDKTAIYYAIETGNMEMVKAMVESGEKWWTRVKVHEIKERSISHGTNMAGQATTIYSTRCFGAGEYIPSRYAKTMDMDEIQDYLKSNNL
jgi:ankyrin repeat protein